MLQNMQNRVPEFQSFRACRACKAELRSFKAKLQSEATDYHYYEACKAELQISKHAEQNFMLQNMQRSLEACRAELHAPKQEKLQVVLNILC